MVTKIHTEMYSPEAILNIIRSFKFLRKSKNMNHLPKHWWRLDLALFLLKSDVTPIQLEELEFHTYIVVCGQCGLHLLYLLDVWCSKQPDQQNPRY